MIALIPARGGSKGLPGKNIRDLNGFPLIAHTIRAANQSNSISRVIVSTEDHEIAAISEEFGAEVPFLRPKRLAEDHSMVMDAYFYTLDKLFGERDQKRTGSFVALLPTVPLRLASDIDKAIEVFNRKDADSVISMVEAPVPITWYKKLNPNGSISDDSLENPIMKNRQEEDKLLIPNGAIYIFKTKLLRRTRQYYTKKTFPYIMPVNRSIDIDTIDDFRHAEFLLQTSKKNSG